MYRKWPTLSRRASDCHVVSRRLVPQFPGKLAVSYLGAGRSARSTSARRMASRRIAKELKDFKADPIPNMSVQPVADDLYHCQATLIGPEGSPYEGGHFKLDIRFPLDYPFSPPKIMFITKMYHPNINKQGNICLDILMDRWSAALSVSRLLLSISSLLTDPNPDHAFDHDMASLYRTDRAKYNATARSWTLEHAKLDSATPTKTT